MEFASLQPKLASLAASNVLFGTSSWKYEGWLGQLYTPSRYEYRGKVAASRFEAQCLEEYSEIFPTVCVDAGFYRFPSESYVAKLAAQIPENFKLSWKATDEITIRKFPRLDRHGDRAGKLNENFLNAPLFVEAFLGPMSPFRDQIGVIMFEFSHFHPGDFNRGRDFVAALDHFLSHLPTEWQFGVEIRNPNLLQPEYFAMLAGHNVTHVFNSWTAMPDVVDQMEMAGSFTADFFAARFLLKPGRKYEEAVKEFSPYTSLKEPYPKARTAMAKLAEKRTKRPSYIFVNNRLEGSALATINAVINSDPDSAKGSP